MDIFFRDNKIVHSLIKTVMTIVLSAILGSTFISILYFTLGNYIEKLMVVKNIKYLLDKFCILNDPIVKNNLNPIVNKLEAPPVGPNDKKIIDQQNQIIVQAFYFYGKINIIVIGLILVLSHLFNISLIPIIIRSLTLLFGIAFVEVLFLCLVTYNFIMAQPNKTFTQMLNAPQLQINLDDETREPSIVSELSNNSSEFKTEIINSVSNFI
jgi:hypothetical protein